MPLTTSKANASAYGLGFTSGKQRLGPYLAAIDLTTGNSLFPTPLKTNGAVMAIESDGAGGVYVGGTFTTINDEPRNYLAHINSSGLVTTWNPSVSSNVYVIKRLGPNVYFGGNFTSVSGQTRNRAAGFNTAGTLLGWNPNVADNSVWAMTTIGVNVYFGGTFTTVSGNLRPGASGMNVSGSFLSGWNPNLARGGGSGYGWCYSMSSLGTNVYIFGDFQGIQGQSRLSAGGVNTSNSLLAWNPSVEGPSQGLGEVWASTIVGTDIYFGGNITAVLGSPATNAACVRTDGVRMGWYPEPNGTVRAIFADSGRIRLAGNFTSVSSSSGLPQAVRRYAAFENAVFNGSANFIQENVFANGIIFGLSTNGNNVFIGGDFTDASR